MAFCQSSQLRGPPRLKLVVDKWCSARLPIDSEASPGVSDPVTSLEDVPPPPLLGINIPASRTLVIL
jgi:hypothetical protein